MGSELLIATIPGRTGLYLGYQVNGAWRSIARFSRGQESADEFVSWAQKAGIKFEDTRKEGSGE